MVPRSTIDAHVGRKVRAARRLRHLSIEALAEAIAMEAAKVRACEAGIQRFSAENLFRLGKVLSLEPSSLYVQDHGRLPPGSMTIRGSEASAPVQPRLRSHPRAR